MFIVNDKLVYQITRKSAIEGLGFAIEEKLKAHYNEKVLKAVVSEILQHVEFPEVMDSNDVYIYHNEKFMKYVLATSGIQETAEQYEISYFKPRYNGPEVRQIFDVLEYSMEQLLFRQNHYKNAMIVQSGDEKFSVVSMIGDVKAVIAQRLSKFLSESDSQNIANNIIENFYSDSMLMAGLRQNGDMTYYSLGTDNACKRLSIFDAKELYKAIMSFFPSLEVLSARAKMAAIYLHNYILYGFEIQDYELRNPYRFDGKEAIFKRTVRGIDFYLYRKVGVWVSDYIKCNAKDIVYNKHRDTQREYPYHEVFYEGTYKGFPIFQSTDEIDKKISIYAGRNEAILVNLPIIMEGTKIIEHMGNHKIEFKTAEKRSYVSYYDCYRFYDSDDMEVYLRVTIK